MAKDNNFDSNILNYANKIKETLENLGNIYQTEEDIEEILSILMQDETFENTIEQILGTLNDEIDISSMQQHIIAIIKKYLQRRSGKNSAISIDAKLITQNITEISSFLMDKRAKIIKSATKNFNNIKDKYSSITELSRTNLKRLIKGFIIYQIYKITNPKRLAGETKRDNFAHNVIMRGMKVAKKYEGGKASDIKSYGVTFMNNLQKAAVKVKKNNNTLSI
jgi:hypothetical protein